MDVVSRDRPMTEDTPKHQCSICNKVITQTTPAIGSMDGERLVLTCMPCVEDLQDGGKEDA
jgi:hypothetical protein